MNIIYRSCCLLLIATTSYSQPVNSLLIPFDDAKVIELELNKPAPSAVDIKAIIINYGITLPTTNPYLISLNSYAVDINRALGPTRQPTVNLLDGGTSSLLNPVLVADALATFIANRFKAEVNAAFLTRFRAMLDRPDSLNKLLPQTFITLRQSDPYNYTTFLQTLKEAVNEDLRHLPRQALDYVIFNKDHIVNKLTNPVALDIGLASLQIAADLQDGRTGLETLSRLETSGGVGAMTNAEAQLIVKVVSILSRNVVKGNGALLTQADLYDLRLDHKLLNLYVGLLIEKEKKSLSAINLSTGITLYQRLQDVSPQVTDVFALLSAMNQFQEAFKQTQSRITTELAKASDTYKPNVALLYIDLFQTGISVLRSGLTNYQLLTSKPLPNTINTYFDLASGILPVVRYTWEKQYGLALTNAVSLLQTLYVPRPGVTIRAFTAHQVSQLNRINKKVRKLTAGSTGISFKYNASTISTALLTPYGVNIQSSVGDTRSAVLGELMKYGSFVVTMAKAETKAEIVDALETAALPVGSYRIKRNNHFSVSVNSFGGIYGGYQNLNGNRSALLAPSAPVGLYAGWGTNQVNVQQKDGNSFGLFVTLIDVGAIFALRLQDTTHADLPDFTWKNLMAPGAYLVFGLRNVLSVGAGVQYGPQLQAVDPKSNVINPQAWRFGIKFTADIPIFNLFVRPNSKHFKENGL